MTKHKTIISYFLDQTDKKVDTFTDIMISTFF